MDEEKGRNIAGDASDDAPASHSSSPRRAGLAWKDEPLAEALAIQRALGDAGPLWIAGRIGALASSGDFAGVRRFQLIAAKYARLLPGTVQ